ncbi:uncharacterized protein LOC128283838 [Gossypium arboreum]|uniref:uncharacterized protein LOC128283838 n=1 Tax=Gossypium arboreum TaxID=29729 RepID=UPI0022F1AB4A|nr:uncharacterized protein LOC128283838 [Gossypium arboreum]
MKLFMLCELGKKIDDYGDGNWKAKTLERENAQTPTPTKRRRFKDDIKPKISFFFILSFPLSFSKKKNRKTLSPPFVSLTIGFSLLGTPPPCSVAGDAQKWVFQPRFGTFLKAKPSASYKNKRREPSAPFRTRLQRQRRLSDNASVGIQVSERRGTRGGGVRRVRRSGMRGGSRQWGMRWLKAEVARFFF